MVPRERHERLDLDEEPVRSGARAHEVAHFFAEQHFEHLPRVQPVQLDRKTHFSFSFSPFVSRVTNGRFMSFACFSQSSIAGV
jgi:hypothetical protein